MMNLHVPDSTLAKFDPVWRQLYNEAQDIAAAEPAMAEFIHVILLGRDNLAEAVVYRVAAWLEHSTLPFALARDLYNAALADNPELGLAFSADLMAVYERDPACHRFIEPYLYFKGFAALQCHRLAHVLWKHDRKDLALLIQHRVAVVMNIDIHPAAVIGKGIMLDHASGFVCGETTIIEDNVSILHNVTLGGNGRQEGDRHPKIRHGVLIGAGAKVLGRIEVGACARVAAGSVVLENVPPCKTVAGVPARIIGDADCEEPARKMDHCFSCDYHI